MKAICLIKISDQKPLNVGYIIPFQYTIVEMGIDGIVIDTFECDGVISDMSINSPFIEIIKRAKEIANKNL